MVIGVTQQGECMCVAIFMFKLHFKLRYVDVCFYKGHLYLKLFTFMHLADAFIQSDLQCIQAIHLLSVCQYVCSLGIEPTTFARLTQCSTTEPQEHYNTQL